VFSTVAPQLQQEGEGELVANLTSIVLLELRFLAVLVQQRTAKLVKTRGVIPIERRLESVSRERCW
jgi:hypothetical protein